MLGYAKGATPVEWLTAETINLAEERRKLKSKRRGNPQAAKHHSYLCRKVKRRAKKDRALYKQGLCKKVKEARLHKKNHILSTKLSDDNFQIHSSDLGD